MTTTNTVEGYVVSEYLGCVSASACYLPGGAIGEGYINSMQSAMYTSAYNDALSRMKTEVQNKADAIIGIQSSVCSMNGVMSFILVTVSGTAVKLEKIIEPLPVTERSREKAEEEKRQALERVRLEEHKRQLEEQHRTMLERGEITAVDREALLTVLRSLDSAADMMTEAEKAQSIDPTLFSPEILETLRKNIETGRVYGKRVGALNFIKQVEQYFG